jgi:hypothetical protein
MSTKPATKGASNRVEGTELVLHASGDMPKGWAEHLQGLFDHWEGLRKLKLIRSETSDEVEDVVIQSAMVLAEDRIEELDREFAKREIELQRNPPPADKQELAIAKTIGNLKDVDDSAAELGIRLVVTVDRS